MTRFEGRSWVTNCNFVFEQEIEFWKQLASFYQISWRDSFLKWDNPSDLGIDFSLTFAIEISSRLEKKPSDISSEITSFFPSSYSNVEYSVNQLGYINFKFKDSFYIDFLSDFEKFVNFDERNEKINVEYVSTNPTGYLHLGHLRNAIVGDAIANIYKVAGYQVTREYYINDRGNQIKKASEAILYYYCKTFGIDFPLEEDDISYKSSDIISAAEYFALNNSFSQEQIFNQRSEIEQLVVNYFITKIREQLSSIGVYFDQWFSEKEMYKDQQTLASLLTDFRSRGFLFEQDGALFLKTSLIGDSKDRVIIKADKEYTYFLSDIIYHLDKLSRNDILVNVWGSDHHGYVDRLLSSLKMLGNKKEISIVLIQMVSLLAEGGESQKFSKRLNNTIGLQETLQFITADQLRFSILEKDANHSLQINTEELRRKGKETRLHHIQYAHARCSSLLDNWNRREKEKSKQKLVSKDVSLIFDQLLINSPEEKNLMKLTFRFKQFVSLALEKKNPSLISHYLSSLSKAFQSYYHSTRVIDEKNEQLSEQRVFLVKVVMVVLAKSLRIYGIEPLERM